MAQTQNKLTQEELTEQYSILVQYLKNNMGLRPEDVPRALEEIYDLIKSDLQTIKTKKAVS